MKRFGVAMTVFAIAFLVSVGAVRAQEHPWFDDPGQPGHYAVGHTGYLLADPSRSDRPIYFGVWYPADPGSINSSPPAQYPLDPYTGATNVPITPSTAWEALGFEPAYEGPPLSRNKPFPLVVVSPGATEDVWQMFYVGTRLASHGYVVAVAEHWADCEWSWGACDDFVTTMLNRPRDISFIISQILEKNRTRGEFLFNAVDPERIAALGHSIGGYTVFTLAGGNNQVCDALWPAITGYDTLPYPSNTCVPTFPDRRVKAIVSLDGSTQFLRYGEMSRISVPSLILGETVDQEEQLGVLTGLPDPTQVRDTIPRAHAAINRFDSYRVDVNGANHMSFAILCEAIPLLYQYGAISYDLVQYFKTNWPCVNTGVDPMLIPAAETHEVVTKYTIAFLDIYFHNPDSALWLDLWILSPEYALTHTPTVQFFYSEACHAQLPNDQYFSYRPYQTSRECDVALKDPTGFFAPYKTQ